MYWALVPLILAEVLALFTSIDTSLKVKAVILCTTCISALLLKFGREKNFSSARAAAAWSVLCYALFLAPLIVSIAQGKWLGVAATVLCLLLVLKLFETR